METVDCLQALGLVTDGDLVTYRELYPEDYAQDGYKAAVYDTGEETVEVYGVSGARGAAVFPA